MGLADTLAKLKGDEPVLKFRRGSEATAQGGIVRNANPAHSLTCETHFPRWSENLNGIPSSRKKYLKGEPECIYRRQVVTIPV